MDEYWRVSTVHQADGKDVIVLKVRGAGYDLTLCSQADVDRLVSDLEHAAANANFAKADPKKEKRKR